MAQAQKSLLKAGKKKNQKGASRKPSVKTYHNYIDGRWQPGASGETYENINPADTRDLIGRFPLSTEEDLHNAVQAAQNAAERWRRTPAPRRAEILFRLGEILM